MCRKGKLLVNHHRLEKEDALSLFADDPFFALVPSLNNRASLTSLRVKVQ